MRLLAILLTVALATSAGCFGKDDETPTDTTPTTGTGTTPATGATPTGATPTPGAGGAGNNTTAPTKPAPKELCAVSFSFGSNVQPAAPPTHVTAGTCGSVTAGYTSMTLNVTFTADPAQAPVIAANGISVVVLDAAGTAVVTCAGPGPGPAAALACSGTGPATVGDYTLQYNGQGNVAVSGNVMVS